MAPLPGAAASGSEFLFFPFEVIHASMWVCLDTLLSRQSDFWACLKLNYECGKNAGIVSIQREGDALYMYRVDAKSASNIEFQCLYYNCLEDIRSLVNKHGIRSIHVVPLYGYGVEMYTDSMKHISGEEIITTQPRIHLTYSVCLHDSKPSKRTAEFLRYI